MGEFRFKRFSVINERSAMKVNTDGVLLGALMTLRPDDRMLLDIGTGTGTVALMAAQRLSDMAAGCGECRPDVLPVSDDLQKTERGSVQIRAIDIDGPSASEAAANFARSPWPEMLSSENISLEDFSSRMETEYNRRGTESLPPFDMVFSNPPYFESELKSPDPRRRESRHSDSMSYREILLFSSRWLSPHGRCSVILPSETETDLCRYARMCGLFPFRVVRIRTVPHRPPRRTVVEFSRHRQDAVSEEGLVIQEKGRYTDRYTDLTSPFYLQF